MKNNTLILCRARKASELKLGFALRHEIFVKEKGFEPDSGYGVEQDKQDFHAMHFILRDKESFSPVGYFRILRTPSEHVRHAKFLPEIQCWQKECNFGELSRLLLIREYRNISALQSAFNCISDLLYSMKVSSIHAIMEDSLAKALIRYGYPIKRLSESFPLNGKRSVYLLHRREDAMLKACG